MPLRIGVTFRRADRVVRYERALEHVGLEPVRLAPGLPLTLEGVDGLLLTGGADVNPARYGQSRHPKAEEPDNERDELEFETLRQAFQKELPVLAICRGMQLLNVACGGGLIQHLDTAETHFRPADLDAHQIEIPPGTRLASLMGPGAHVVNSRHHQAVERIGDGLIVSATAGDGVIEAIEKPGEQFVVGVQWHPEDHFLAREIDRKLFEAFAEAVRRALAAPLTP